MFAVSFKVKSDGNTTDLSEGIVNGHLSCCRIGDVSQVLSLGNVGVEGLEVGRGLIFREEGLNLKCWRA